MQQHNSEKKAYWYLAAFVLLVGLIAFLSFYKLDVKYVDPWDEARHGVNAYEMMTGGSLFQNTYLRQADYYNLKPPLSMWCIMLSMAVFGKNVFALRFYSALCYVILAVCAGLFLRRYGRLESLLGMAFLAVNTTAFQAHMVRAGDADSLYVLLFTLAMLAMMRIPENKKYLYACGLLFALAFLTKSFHAGVIALIGGLYLILTGEIKKLSLKNWLLFLLSVILPVLLWALGRIRLDGITFFQKMWETDVLGRTDGTLQSNPASFSYYFSYYFGGMSGKTTVYLCALVFCLLALCLFNRFFAWKNRNAYIGWILWAAVPMLAFSAVSNKLLWYVYPSLVPLLLAAGVSVAKLIKSGKLLPVFRAAAALCAAVVLVWFVRGEIVTINGQSSNDFQLLIREIAANDAYDGCKVYVDYSIGEDGDTNSTWSQQDVFVAEAYGDYECEQGGVLGVLEENIYEDRGVILFAGADVYEKNKELYDSFELLGERGEYKAFAIKY